MTKQSFLQMRKVQARQQAAEKAKVKHSHPLIIRLFYAIIALKRLVKIRRKYMLKRESLSHTSKSAFLNEIQKSHRAVKYASFGRTVVNIDGAQVQQYRAEELERAVQDKIKKQERLEKLSRRRGGAREGQANLATTLQQFDLANGLARVEKGSVADRIRALKTNFPVNTSLRENNVRKSKMSGGLKETTTKDITHVLQKNVHISMTQTKKHEPNITNKIKNNLKIMKKMNTQEVLNYAAGTAVYFGATLAFQSRHGGYLSYNNFADIKASAPKIVPAARFVVWNCDDLNDHGILRYGDAVWLQAGAHEVLGAQYGGGTISADGARKLKPSLINCRRENAFKAQQYGRWIVLNRENPSDTLGDQVLHHDKIMLEQEWCYLASHTPYDSFMEKSHSFEDSENKEGADFFKPIEECIWRLHLVTLPSDDNADARFREYLLDQAKEQIKFSAQDRRLKERVLSGPLSRRISDNLKPEEVVKRHLPQKCSADAAKIHLLKKYDRQMKKDFSQYGTKVSTLKNIYGPHSVVYKNAKAAETALRLKNSKTANDLRNTELQKTLDASGPKLSLEETEDLYWDLATNVLTDTRAWESLPVSMEVYEDLDQSKKEMAIRVLQKFARNKLSVMFNWKRTMRGIDVKETSKLSNSLLYQASEPSKKPAIFQEQDEQALTSSGGKDKTFLTTGDSVSSPSPNMSRRVSKASAGEVTPELARLQQVMHVMEAEEVVEEKRFTRKHFRRGSSSEISHYYHVTGGNSRPHTAPAQEFQQDNEMDAQDMRHLTRHERRNLLASASTSSVHAVNAARMLLHGSSSANLLKKDRRLSMDKPPSMTSDEDEEEVIEYDMDKESGVDDDGKDIKVKIKNNSSNNNSSNDLDTKGLSPNGCSDPSTHRILGRFEPKKHNKKQQFNKIINSLSKSQDPACGLPQDVFDDPHQDVSVSTSLSFLRASSSAPHIYSDIKTKRRKDKYVKKVKQK